MTTGTEGPDNLSNDQSLTNETVDALGGDDVITVRRPTPTINSGEKVQVNGGAGFDTIIVDTATDYPRFNSVSTSGFDGSINFRGGSGISWFLNWTSIERLELQGSLFSGTYNFGDEIDILRLKPDFGGTLNAGGGNDEIYFSGQLTIRTIINGGTGNDVIDLTAAGNSSTPRWEAFGGDGDDILRGSMTIDLLNGDAGNDVLTGNGFFNAFPNDGDMFTGGAGNDTITGASDASTDWLRYDLETGGGAVRVNLGTGSATLGGIDVAAGTARDTFGNTDTLTSIERVSGNSANDFFAGGAANDRIGGEAGADNFYMYLGGNDNVSGDAGNDIFFFGAALTAADMVTGGADYDTLVVQGNYAGGLTLSANVTGIEAFSILGGNNTNFGEPGTNSYNYVITTHDANFAAGVQARVNGAALLATENFTFNGSAETDASFVVYGSRGVDSLTGGLGNDIFFYAEQRFAPGDIVNGGPGYDGMFLRGNYVIDFNAPGYHGLLTSIENMTLTSATDERYARGGGTEFDYNVKLADAHVAAGVTLTVSGALLMATETMVLDGSLESDGNLNLFGGRAADTLKGGGGTDLIHGNLGADQLTGGGGADTFRYDATAESNLGALDQILDFTPGTDKIDVTRIDANTTAGGDQAFTWIGSDPFSSTAGELRAEFLNGMGWFLEGDTDGNGSADFVVMLTLQGPTPLGAGDFFL